MTTPRRVPRPVRLTLAAREGSAIDGAWWPRGSSVAYELPELVSALHPKLGEIADIQINWAATEGASDLHAVGLGTLTSAGVRRQPRLMFITGARVHARLLVIPSTTSAELGALVLKIAAGQHIQRVNGDTEIIKSAERVLVAAQAASLSWSRKIA